MKAAEPPRANLTSCVSWARQADPSEGTLVITAITSRRLLPIGLHIAQGAIILIALTALLYAVGAPLYNGG